MDSYIWRIYIDNTWAVMVKVLAARPPTPM